MMEESLSIWTITRNRTDFPGKHVARRHIVHPLTAAGPTEDHFVADKLDQVRACLPPGLINLGRNGADHPIIVESWI
ncbi:hypothetical protein [Sphingomonas sp. GM_Shp_1]|uniref:hypothetical protein n=1 Tax=Sphingomonas sp. GM_Shp_1 TaxID=2937381 RepID=UPI00226B0180|nr:hypothetical protein [Sphingomonas sp. GM_Shp_1]